MYKDETFGLTVTKNLPIADWNTAVLVCENLNYGGFSSGWRLPNTDEFLTLLKHGLNRLASPGFITTASINSFGFWSASSTSNSAVFVGIKTGGTAVASKSRMGGVICVRGAAATGTVAPSSEPDARTCIYHNDKVGFGFLSGTRSTGPDDNDSLNVEIPDGIVLSKLGPTAVGKFNVNYVLVRVVSNPDPGEGDAPAKPGDEGWVFASACP